MGVGDDCYDIVEACAKYDWCNGAVGMAGNSWLGISQYFAAMAQPPSLKAIAPWEGYSDMYRDMVRRGGIPWTPFLKWVLLGVPGITQPARTNGRSRKTRGCSHFGSGT